MRGFDDALVRKRVDEVEQSFKNAADKYGAELVFNRTESIKAYKTDENSSVVKRFKNACKRVGISFETKSTRGGSDNNIFALHGIEGIVVSCGMMNVHSVSEYAYVQDIEKTTELIYELLISE